MIIVIRGTNGSGKSHAVRSLLKKARRVLPSVRGTAEGSSLILIRGVKRPVLIVGPYIAGRSMGGCDCIRRPREIYESIDLAIAKDWHVVLEGVVLATRPYISYKQKDGYDVRYAFFDPPIRTCLERIAERQKLKGHVSELSQDAMQYKLSRAEHMYREAQRVGMVTKRFQRSPVNALPWILHQLRTP